MARILCILAVLAMLCAAAWAGEPPRVLDVRLHHLRIDGPREWSDFPEQAESPRLEVSFTGGQSDRPQTLRLRQQDVKQSWLVTLNGKELGRLSQDEKDQIIYLVVPAGAMTAGENVLQVAQPMGGKPERDDIRVGELLLDRRPLADVLAEAQVEIQVLDADIGQPLPARVTVVNADGALQTVGATSGDHLAVRPGVVYTSTGSARFGAPAGKYIVYAGRGFEYSLDRVELSLAAGATEKRVLRIRREVSTDGYVACDTHVHTLTHSGHGDATVLERMVTLTGEGIELPIATDHNAHIDHGPFAEQMRVRDYFTPVIGNEVTTRLGHFNILPVQPGARVPDSALDNWSEIFDDIFRTSGVKIAILNHARDLHSGVRPFGPTLYNAVVAENLEGWPLRFNGMEVINSGATQTDGLRLFHDWMGLLNRGHAVTPVGSSDSHDVARYIVGQGRTYIRADDGQPGRIDVEQAVDSFLHGRVMVSYGLLAEMTVNDKHGSGDVVTLTDDGPAKISVRILGPHWTRASRVSLYANGRQVREATVNSEPPAPGVKWNGEWELERPRHDVHLVAIAVGPGVDGPYWKTARPYQPTSPDWQAYMIGCSGAVWLDADGDGRKTSAYGYAQRLVESAGGDLAKLVTLLADYDQAVAAHAGHLYQLAGGSLLDEAAKAALDAAAPATREGFRQYLNAFRESQLARDAP